MSRSLALSPAAGAPAFLGATAPQYELLGDHVPNGQTVAATIKLRPGAALFAGPAPRYTTATVSRSAGGVTAFAEHHHRDIVLSLSVSTPTSGDLDRALGELVRLFDPIVNPAGVRLTYTPDGGTAADTRFIEGHAITTQPVAIQHKGSRVATVTGIIRCSDPYWLGASTEITIPIDQAVSGNTTPAVNYPDGRQHQDYARFGAYTITTADIPVDALPVWPRFRLDYSGTPSTRTIVQIGSGLDTDYLEFGDRFEARTFHTDPKYRGLYYQNEPDDIGFESTLLAGSDLFQLVPGSELIVVTNHDVTSNDLVISFDNRFLTPS